MVKLARQRRYDPSTERAIAGYVAVGAPYSISKVVEVFFCDVSRQGSERASAWVLRLGKRRLGSYETLREAKAAAG
jgi:hypothetical protein